MSKLISIYLVVCSLAALFMSCGTPTPLPRLSCGNTINNGAYLYSEKSLDGDCYFVPEGQTQKLPFSPKSVAFVGDGVNVNLCNSDDGQGACTEVNDNKDDLSFASNYGNFHSAKVRAAYTSDCQDDQKGVKLYSEKEFRGSCRFKGVGRYELEFSPRSVDITEGFGLNLCKNPDGEDPCTELHNDENDLSFSSIYDQMKSAVVTLDE